MASNGITSGRVPATLRPSDRIDGAGMPAFEGDRILEQLNGDMGELARAAAEPLDNISTTTTIDLLNQAGLRVRRGLTGQS